MATVHGMNGAILLKMMSGRVSRGRQKERGEREGEKLSGEIGRKREKAS